MSTDNLKAIDDNLEKNIFLELVDGAKENNYTKAYASYITAIDGVYKEK